MMVQAKDEQRSVKTAGLPKGWIFVLFTGAIIAYAVAERPLVSSIKWGDDLAAARLAAQQGGQGRPVLVEFTGAGCPYCKKMERDVLVQPEVERQLRDFIPVRVDWRQDQALAVRYHVDAIPTFVILDPSGKPTGKLVGYHTAEQFMDFLRRVGEIASNAAGPVAPAR